jgi:hypothetical protein
MLLNKYSDDSEFSLKFLYLKGLAFIQPDNVIDAFELIMEDDFYQRNEGILHVFITYFESTWLGPWNRRTTTRIAPRYAVTHWTYAW